MLSDKDLMVLDWGTRGTVIPAERFGFSSNFGKPGFQGRAPKDVLDRLRKLGLIDSIGQTTTAGRQALEVSDDT